MNVLPGAVFDAAMDEIAERSRKRLYQTDYLAWAADILGRRYYKKMAEIAVEITTPANGKTRTAVKSSNGAGKSFLISDVQTWWVTAFPPEDSLAITSANGRDQIERVVYKMLKDNYGYMARRAQVENNPSLAPIGWISEQLEWNYTKPDGSGKGTIAFGKRPADSDIVSSFQGTRKRRTLVGFDEMGGLPEDLFTAAEAVLTGAESRFVGIGNPDRRGTPFHRLFTSPASAADWNLYTISAYDLPTITGEVVYPDEPEKEARMLDGLTAAKWIYHKERAWKTGGEIFFDEDAFERSTIKSKDRSWFFRNTTGKKDARFLAKVDGEFPGETDNSFFPEDDIVLAQETTIEPGDAPVFLGVDVAAMGADESVVYVNQGGHVRLFSKTIRYDDGGEMRTTSGVWSKEDEFTTARRVHAIATYLGATEVRIDAAGMGAGIATTIMRLPELADKCYTLIRVVGSNMSTDKDAWQLNRDENHDALRRKMHEGLIDLDPADTLLRDELLLITYDLNNRGAIKITKKRDMKTEIGGSPDRTDALIYATIDTGPLVNNPLGNLNKGDPVTLSPYELLQLQRGGPGWPI